MGGKNIFELTRVCHNGKINIFFVVYGMERKRNEVKLVALPLMFTKLTLAHLQGYNLGRV
jgi:hypothetical protein